jgi:hypothetical protein
MTHTIAQNETYTYVLRLIYKISASVTTLEPVFVTVVESGKLMVGSSSPHERIS